MDNRLGNPSGPVHIHPDPYINYLTVVVYFMQHLSAAHSERWLKYAFLTLFYEIHFNKQSEIKNAKMPTIKE